VDSAASAMLTVSDSNAVASAARIESSSRIRIVSIGIKQLLILYSIAGDIGLTGR
jgi:hypothetical protein